MVLVVQPGQFAGGYQGETQRVGKGMMRIWTIGHSTRPVEELIALLQEQGVERVVDVRRFPGSRRHPQYGRDALAEALERAGMEYVHEPGLGGRRPAARDSRNTYWRDPGFRGYADHMATPEFEDALRRLELLAAERPTAILCAEAVPWRCHRQLVADALVTGGHEVTHIVGTGRAEPHRLNGAARVSRGGVLTYPGEPEAGPLFEEGGNGDSR